MTTGRRRRAREAGQTFTETAMILGIVTAIIVSVTTLIVPAYSQVVARLVLHMVVYVGTFK